MHLIPIYITEEQRDILFAQKKKTGTSVAAQIREAIDRYIDNFKGEK